MFIVVVAFSVFYETLCKDWQCIDFILLLMFFNMQHTLQLHIKWLSKYLSIHKHKTHSLIIFLPFLICLTDDSQGSIEVLDEFLVTEKHLMDILILI